MLFWPFVVSYVAKRHFFDTDHTYDWTMKHRLDIAKQRHYIKAVR